MRIASRRISAVKPADRTKAAAAKNNPKSKNNFILSFSDGKLTGYFIKAYCLRKKLSIIDFRFAGFSRQHLSAIIIIYTQRRE
jgi:hypothetical protein